jgi:hypothetical protein
MLGLHAVHFTISQCTHILAWLYFAEIANIFDSKEVFNARVGRDDI